ncbi:hypothetical protein HanIR_Chr06g0271491 [Helianthus annuus]|nr:hypothetical protein HanIR_Chr06g0271491 [Helianthus annuus]
MDTSCHQRSFGKPDTQPTHPTYKTNNVEMLYLLRPRPKKIEKVLEEYTTMK